MKSAFVALLSFVALATAQSQPYGQCGGQGWTGAKTCTSGWTCTYSNAYYSQCLPGSSSPTTTKPPITTSKSTTSTVPTSTGSAPGTTPTLYLAGDSTMAPGGGGAGTNGWGEYLAQYLTIPVINDAVAGRSARSYTAEGRFTTIINAVKKGDFVIIEFGHNDGFVTPDNGREDANADGYAPVQTVTAATGVVSVIHTFDYYMTNAVRSIQAKGGNAIVSSYTPDNIWTNGKIGGGGRFVTYAQEVATNTTAAYVDHYDYVAQAYDKIGQTTVTTYYPNDHTHTSPTGANVVAEAFVRGLLCGGSALASKVNAAGQKAPNGCL